MKAVFTAVGGGGQYFVEEVRDRSVGSGPEMTEADVTEVHPPGFGFCGGINADLDPTNHTLTISDFANGNSCGYDTIELRVQDPDVVKLDVISDNYAGGPKAQIAGQPGDWTITWQDASLYDTQTSVFKYAEPPVPQPPFVPGPLGLSTANVPHLRGHMMSVDVDGFAPGEPYKVRISGVVVGHGNADADGQVHRKVRVPLRAHRPRAKLVVKGSQHRVHQLIRIRNGIAEP